jgi:predicted ATPase
MAAGISDLLVRLSGYAPLTVVLEDVHVADDGTLRLLEELCSAVQDRPILLVCTVCSEDDTGGRLLERLEGEGGGACLHLPPLAADQTEILVQHLLDGPVEPVVLEAIRTLAGGNPYYIEEAVQALRGRKRIRLVEGIWRVRPEITLHLARDEVRTRRTASGDYRLASRLRAG